MKDNKERQARFRALIQGEFRPEFNRAVAIAVRRALRDQRAKQQPQMQNVMMGAQTQLWRAQEMQAKQRYPHISLEQELKNPAFVQLLTNRQNPMTVCQAYEVVHLDEIRTQIARQAALQTARHMESLVRRPRESGTAPHAGMPVHWGASNPKTRAEIARRAMRGEHITL